MTTTSFLFYVFSAVLLGSSFAVITARSTVHAVLFLFVVMMLDFNTSELRRGFWTHFPLAALVGVLIALEMALVLLGGFRGVQPPPVDPQLLKMGNTRMLGI